MKKQFYLPLITLFLLFSFAAKATNHNITVVGSYPNFAFSPGSLNVNVGDSITWQQDFQTHPLASLNIPEGAAPFSYNGLSPAFSYVVTMQGMYSFECTTHLFTGEFTASVSTGIQQNNQPATVVSVYPNYSNDVVNLSVKQAFNTATKLNAIVYNALGNEVLNFDFLTNNPTIIHVANLANGIYFVAVRDNNSVLSVQKIVKD